MTTSLDFLSDQEVRQITALVDTLDRSNFDYLQVDVGTVKVTIGKGALPLTTGVPAISAPAPGPAPVAAAMPAGVPVASMPATAAPAAAVVSSTGGSVPAAAADAVPAGWLPILATTMGRFYSRPDPNSPPFVQIGTRVAADDTVCLIEVMKLFNAITAGVEGTVMKVCIEDAAVVEFGQVLFYVQP